MLRAIAARRGQFFVNAWNELMGRIETQTSAVG
jgi:hypothetical protein